MKKILLIRADASVAMGTGHVMRMISLGQAWKDGGGEAVFLCAEITPALESRLKEEGFQLEKIQASAGSREDLEATCTAIARYGTDSIPVALDGYQFDSAFQLGLKNSGCRLLVVDDYGHADFYHADCVLNQNISAREELYRNRSPATQLLLGTKFALLRKEFLRYEGWKRDIPNTAKKVLVTMGGADPDNITQRVCEALAEFDLEVRVVAGGSSPHIGKLRLMVESLSARKPRFELLENASNMPELMAWADLAIATGGSTAWELAYMGLPAALIIVADNQVPIADSLVRAGCALSLGRHTDFDAGQLQSALRSWFADSSGRSAMASRALELVDGLGARRVCATFASSLTITLLTDADSWLNQHICELKSMFEQAGHRVKWIHDPCELAKGDLAFFLSLSHIVPTASLRLHTHNLVVHESALPNGRGWSPLSWQIIEGKHEIPVSLIEAAPGVDTGDIYAQTSIRLTGNELITELRAAQAATTVALCREFVANYPFNAASGRPQSGAPSYYPRRRPADSILDPDKTLREQFNLLRVCDPERYPAYMEIAGRRYEVRLIPLPKQS